MNRRFPAAPRKYPDKLRRGAIRLYWESDPKPVIRRLGLHPGPAFGPDLAVALSGRPAHETATAMAELVDSHLLDESGDGRFRFHDLIRLYAEERARHDTPAACDETVVQLLDWYLGIADVANRVLDPTHHEITTAFAAARPVAPFAEEPQSTLAFLDSERTNLVPVVRLAAQEGHDKAAWQLIYLLTGFFDSRGEWVDRIEMCRLGLAAAQRLAEPVAECLMQTALGLAYLRMLRLAEALDHLYPAMELARTTGDERGEGRIRNSIATAYARLRRYDEAIEIYQRALAIHRRNDDLSGAAVALNNIGTARVRQGRPDLGLADLRAALRLTEEVGNQRMQAQVLGSIGEAYLSQDRRPDALDTFRRALAVQREIDDRRHQVDTMLNIGSALLAEGDHPAALDHLRDALRLSRDLSDQHLTAVCLARLAAVHLHRDELDEAADCLRRALAIRAAVPDAYEEAATCFRWTMRWPPTVWSAATVVRSVSVPPRDGRRSPASRGRAPPRSR